MGYNDGASNEVRTLAASNEVCTLAMLNLRANKTFQGAGIKPIRKQLRLVF